MEPNFITWSQALRARLDEALSATLPRVDLAPTHLHAAMRYAALAPGKRMRPLLVFAAGAISHASEQSLMAVAVSLELMHAYSLVHDDLPCMDDDDLRRGRPTCHRAFNEATALLVGDALQTLAFECLTEAGISPHGPQHQLGMVRTLALASGSGGMAGGQAIDLEAVGKPLSLAALETMHRKKTGALMRAAIRLGVECGLEIDDSVRLRVDQFSDAIGLAFQVVDDVLDATGDTATLGKTAGKDAEANKPTFTSLLGIEAASRYAHELVEEARQAIRPLLPRSKRLLELADYTISRAS